MFYFAYGSNMSSARLKARVALVRVISVATLPGHALRFHKTGQDGSAKCDAFATANANDAVIGVLFELDSVHKATLDRYEGLGAGYDDKRVVVRTPDGELHAAVTYAATQIDTTLTPYDWYVAHVLRGAREHGLPADYLARIAAVTTRADADRARYGREMSVYGDRRAADEDTDSQGAS